MAFTKQELKQFRKDFKTAVENLEKNHNVNIKLGSIRFGDIEFTTKMTCTKMTEQATNTRMERAKDEFRMYAELRGVNPDLFGKSYIKNGITYTIIGINSRARKYPIVLQGSNGRTYKSDWDMVVKFHFRNYENEKENK